MEIQQISENKWSLSVGEKTITGKSIRSLLDQVSMDFEMISLRYKATIKKILQYEQIKYFIDEDLKSLEDKLNQVKR